MREKHSGVKSENQIGDVKQGHKCSDRSRSKEPGNRLLTQSGECQRSLPERVMFELALKEP